MDMTNFMLVVPSTDSVERKTSGSTRMLIDMENVQMRVIMNGPSINLYYPTEATKRFLKTNFTKKVFQEQTPEKENFDLLFYSDGIQLDLTVSNFDVSFVNIDTEIMVLIDFIHKIRSKKKWFWAIFITKNREMYKIENAVLKLLLCI
ncbi:hypothetical protein CRE_19881 [Caenorhabditis remanei]|uniref:Uncharacterized protein n=1 Tax=Caenorhabditis remanei TaxID=31234 RepID=E3N2X6_CAERE|nr:hypothetical protein CRE_19881 [Caenorhabditis remanei]